MSTTIKCPNCSHQFEPTDALAQSIEEQLKKEFNEKWQTLSKKREEEYAQKEQKLKQAEALLLQEKESQAKLYKEKLEEQKKMMEQEMAETIGKQVQQDYETRLKLMEDTNKQNEQRLVEARSKELEYLKQMQLLKNREEELELEVQRKLMEGRQALSEIIKKEEEEKIKLREEEFLMRLREKDKQLEDQKKLVEEMKRKSEQGSMQLQGEVQELALENLLKATFPFDVIEEVGKGVRGADCIQIVRNNFGQECGKIIFESKRTKDFSEEWIEKLKADMRSQGADIAVLVTQAMPKDMDGFGERKGVWVCSFNEVKPLVYVLRDLITKVYLAAKSQENKGDKMALLYNYLTSGEFAEQWKAIREGFLSMKISIQKERDQMEKLWKAREKQLEKVLLNAAHIRGSIEGIAGMDVDLNLIEEAGDTELID